LKQESSTKRRKIRGVGEAWGITPRGGGERGGKHLNDREDFSINPERVSREALERLENPRH